MRSRFWMGWFAAALLAMISGCGDDSGVSITPAGTGGSAGGGAGSGGGGGGGGAAVSYPVPEWPTGAPEDQGLSAAQLQAAADIAEQNDSYCLLVIRHGVLVAEWYWQGHVETTPQVSWSIAKSYSSALTGIAIANGDIGGIDQHAADYIPEWQGTPRDQITIRHLLSMTSGLEWSAFEDYVTMATFAQDHTQHALGRQLDVAPGTEWVYNNAAVQILEPLFRNATGMTVEQYAEQHLWSKIGMSASWAHDPAGNPTTYASVLASCRDHARLGYLYLHGGRWVDEQVVPAQFVTESLTPSQTMNQAYGFLWWLNGHTPALTALMDPFPGPISPASPPDMFGAHGFGNQFIDVFPSLDMIVVRFGTDPLGSFDLAALADDASLKKHEAIIGPLLQAVMD